ncbi:MAG: tetratricopeptide repeat protein [Acidobacteria bacterium]|nr:tetratricopeptide repeat protein [Acidobacteriota bacterium]
MAGLIRDRYEPLEVVARGGQGTVVRARDRRHDREVTLKIRDAPEDREALLREARVLLALRPHPNLPLIREDFFEDGRYHLVMDWISGTSLQQMLGAGRALPHSMALRYLRDVATAIDHLHAHEPPIVHGDVKPANIVVTPDERVVLLDLGIAAAEGHSEGRAGTPGYRAPEVSAGKRATRAADIYGLAATAFAVLTGAPPEGVLPKWSALTPERAAGLERAIREALATDPARRPTSAAALIARIESWLAGSLPGGTLTFFFTDVEGSTVQWESVPESMSAALRTHDRIMWDTVERHGGRVVKARGEGDSIFAVFPEATEAVIASADAQLALAAETWPEGVSIRVRAALHTGEAETREEDYYGPVVNRCARLRATAYGGQTVISGTTGALVADRLPERWTLRDLGLHRLKDLARPERVFQLCHPDLPGEFPPLKSLSALPHNLPVQMTSFVGRERELGEVREALGRSRLLTLAGPGGSGKTRLALQAAADLLEEFPDGIWLAALAAVSDPGLVEATVASAAGIREQPGRSLGETLVESLGPKRLLILLDNCEHLVDACAGFADTLLASCEGVRILATSREILRVPGETVLRVPSLSVPDGTVAPEALERFESVRLFSERARLSVPGFAITPETAGPVAEICRRLDGIPLAIELAAARLASLSVGQIAARLDDRFRLLTGGSRAALPRQQTLRALIEWSVDLLSEEERALFERLSVFAGPFSLEAAEAVCSGEDLPEPDVVPLLSALVDKSLVSPDERDEGIRYSMLESVRRLARERLAARGDAPVLDRHLDWFLTWASRAAGALQGPEQGRWLDLLDRDHDNLRAALDRSLQNGREEAGLRLAGALGPFWSRRGYLTEGRAWLDRILDASERSESEPRARAFLAAGVFAWYQGKRDSARSCYEESLSLARGLGNRALEADALNNLAILADDEARYGEARALYEEALGVRRALGDRAGTAEVLGNLGIVSGQEGDYVAARSVLEECLRAYRDLGETSRIADVLANVGWAAEQEGDLARARECHEESLTIRRELGNPWGIANSLGNLGGIACDSGDSAEARRLFEEALAIQRDLGDREGIGHSLHGLGCAAIAEGDLERARSLLLEALTARTELRDPAGTASCLEALARLHDARGSLETAARLLGAAEALREASGTPLGPSERPPVAALAEGIRGRLDRFETCRDEGRGASRGDLFALESGDPPGPHPPAR